MSEEIEQTEETAEVNPEVNPEVPAEENVTEQEAPETPAAEEPAEAPPPAAEEFQEEPEEEPHELSRPAIIDLKALLQPISGENPAGENVRYSSNVYGELREARRQDDGLNQGDWQTEIKLADYQQVIGLAIPVLEKESKDIQIAAYLAEALVEEYGLAGLRDSLKLASGLQKRFWETLYPEIDEGDMEGRANAMAWLDEQAGYSIRKAPITDGEGYSLFDYDEAKKLKLPDNYDSLAAEDRAKYKNIVIKLENEDTITQEKWEQMANNSRRAFYEELDVAINECLEELKKLNLVIEEKYDFKQAPSLPHIKKAIEEIKGRTDKLLEQKREEEPDEEDAGEGSEIGEDGVVRGGPRVATGEIANRQDALKRLADVAKYFSKTEPHSPVAHLVNRAVKWGKMPLDTWLEDVIKDQNVLLQLREILGFNTVLPGEEGENTENVQ
jgi:type VI secretion system protein ImpA